MALNLAQFVRMAQSVKLAHFVSPTCIYKMGSCTSVRGESKKFVDFVNKIKSTYAISLKLPYVCDQFNTNKHRKFQTNRLINVVSMAICLMSVSATRSTPRR